MTEQAQKDEVRICPVCGRTFTITAQDKEWFQSRMDGHNRQYALPKRCLSCRRNGRQRHKGD